MKTEDIARDIVLYGFVRVPADRLTIGDCQR